MTSFERKPAVAPAQTLCFDLHPLYATILTDGGTVKEGDVIGLDNDLARVLTAPFAGTLRLLTTGTGSDRRVKAYLIPKESGVTKRRPEPLPFRETTNYLDTHRN